MTDSRFSIVLAAGAAALIWAAGAIKVTAAGDRSLPMCFYPEFPKYNKGQLDAADSYACSAR